MTFDERIPARMISKIRVDEDFGCWIWTGSRQKAVPGRIFPYGRVNFNGKVRPAHRAIYEIINGAVPAGFELDHLCGTPPCVNPAHLEAVTHTENVRRAGNNFRARTHCSRGHEFTPENTRYWPSYGGPNARVCGACRKIYSDTYLARKRRRREGRAI